MASLAELDAQILALTNERDTVVSGYKDRIAALRNQRDAAIMQDKVAAMTEAEREALRQALGQTITPEPAVSTPQVQQPAAPQAAEGSN
jgi:hypothetical protein